MTPEQITKAQELSLEYGKVYFDAETVRRVCKDAKQGNEEAQCRLGRMCEFGYGMPEDDAEAMRWYRKAAEQAYYEAPYYLGKMYKGGKGLSEDYVQAYAWFSIGAQHYLGRMSREELKGIADYLTPEQIAEAQELSREYWKAYSFEEGFISIGGVRQNTGKSTPDFDLQNR